MGCIVLVSFLFSRSTLNDGSIAGIVVGIIIVVCIIVAVSLIAYKKKKVKKTTTVRSAPVNTITSKYLNNIYQI